MILASLFPTKYRVWIVLAGFSGYVFRAEIRTFLKGVGIDPMTSLGLNYSAKILQYIRDNSGTKYKSGGTDSEGYDCSGVIFAAFKSLGIEIPRTASDMWDASEEISESEAKVTPGALIFFWSNETVKHVEISTGTGRQLGSQISAGVGDFSWGWGSSSYTFTYGWLPAMGLR